VDKTALIAIQMTSDNTDAKTCAPLFPARVRLRIRLILVFTDATASLIEAGGFSKVQMDPTLVLSKGGRWEGGPRAALNRVLI
jgi:hypothetical protein